MRLSRVRTVFEELPGWPVAWGVAGAALLHILAAWFQGAFLHPDEHFQILEFAWYKLGHEAASSLAWEFGERMRPAIQPLLAAGVIGGLERLHVFTPFLAAFILRLASTLLGLWVTLELAGRLLPDVTSRPLKVLLVVGSLFLWAGPCLESRFSSENWGGIWLFAGICLALDALEAWPAARRRALALAALAGASWGLSFFCRFQVGFALVGIGAWLIAVRRAPTPIVAAVVVGGLLGAVPNLVADRWLYGQWVLSPWNYVHANIIEGKAAEFGTSPAWRILVPFLGLLIPPFSLVLVPLLAAGCWFARRHVIVWTLVPFVLAHALVAHKEARFMIPMIYALVPMLVLSIQSLPGPLLARVLDWSRGLSGRWTIGAFAAANTVALLVLTVAPINERSAILHWLWEQGRQSPTVVYTLAGSPYCDEGPGLPLNFYRAPGVKVLSLPDRVWPAKCGRECDDEGTAARSLVLYEGYEPPASFGPMAGSCAPVLRTIPAWARRADVFGWIAEAHAWTVCQPTSLVLAWLREPRRPVSH